MRFDYRDGGGKKRTAAGNAGAEGLEGVIEATERGADPVEFCRLIDDVLRCGDDAVSRVVRVLRDCETVANECNDLAKWAAQEEVSGDRGSAFGLSQGNMKGEQGSGGKGASTGLDTPGKKAGMRDAQAVSIGVLALRRVCSRLRGRLPLLDGDGAKPRSVETQVDVLISAATDDEALASMGPVWQAWW